MDSHLLKEGLELLSLTVEADRLALLEKYIAEIELWNKRINLVKATGEKLLIRHILDCAAGVPTIAAEQPAGLLDAGSGAGLPGLVIGILEPSISCTLLDKSGKRTAFLRNCVAILGLENCTVVEGDLGTLREEYDVVCCRAFRPLEITFPALSERVRRGGAMILYKGRRDAIAEEVDAVADQSAGYDQSLVSLDVPFLKEERHLLVYRDTNR